MSLSTLAGGTHFKNSLKLIKHIKTSPEIPPAEDDKYTSYTAWDNLCVCIHHCRPAAPTQSQCNLKPELFYFACCFCGHEPLLTGPARHILKVAISSIFPASSSQLLTGWEFRHKHAKGNFSLRPSKLLLLHAKIKLAITFKLLDCGGKPKFCISQMEKER